MLWMFNNCSSLKELNLSSFDTNQVTNMSHMFRNCSSLKELNLSSFNTTVYVEILRTKYLGSKTLFFEDVCCIPTNFLEKLGSV